MESCYVWVGGKAIAHPAPQEKILSKFWNLKKRQGRADFMVFALFCFIVCFSSQMSHKKATEGQDCGDQAEVLAKLR